MQTKVTQGMLKLAREFNFGTAVEELSKAEFLAAFQYTDRISIAVSYSEGFYTVIINGRIVYWHARPIHINVQAKYISTAFTRAIVKYLHKRRQIVKSLK